MFSQPMHHFSPGISVSSTNNMHDELLDQSKLPLGVSQSVNGLVFVWIFDGRAT